MGRKEKHLVFFEIEFISGHNICPTIKQVSDYIRGVI